MNLDQLPNDLLLDIFNRSNPPELSQICKSSKRMQQLCNNEQLWKNKYINKYGQPTTNIAGSWKSAFIKKSLYPQGKAYAVSSYQPSKEKQEIVAIFYGKLDDIYDKLADILNGEITDNQALYDVLVETYNLYASKTDPNMMTRHQCYELKNMDRGYNDWDCNNIYEFLLELPITGQDLRELIENHGQLFSGDYNKTDRYVIVEEAPVYYT